MNYQLTHDPNTVLRLPDRATVPRFHRFWDEYEQWLDSGGLPLPADERDLQSYERVWRDTEINTIKWLRERHRDEIDLGVASTLSSTQFSEILVYLQQLRDWPQTTGFPSATKRPKAPSWITDLIE